MLAGLPGISCCRCWWPAAVAVEISSSLPSRFVSHARLLFWFSSLAILRPVDLTPSSLSRPDPCLPPSSTAATDQVNSCVFSAPGILQHHRRKGSVPSPCRQQLLQASAPHLCLWMCRWPVVLKRMMESAHPSSGSPNLAVLPFSTTTSRSTTETGEQSPTKSKRTLPGAQGMALFARYTRLWQVSSIQQKSC